MSGDLINGVVSGREKKWSLMSLTKSKGNSSVHCVEFKRSQSCVEEVKKSDNDDHSPSLHCVGLEGGVGGA